MNRAIVCATFALGVAPLVVNASPTGTTDTSLHKCAVGDSLTRLYDADEHSAKIETTPGKRFKVEFTNPCPAAREGFPVQLQSRPVNVCIEKGDTLVFFQRDTRMTCRIKTIEPLPA